MKALFIIAQRGYQENEYSIIKRVLEDAKIDVVTASKEGGACVGAQGGMVKATIGLADVILDNFSAIVVIGGPGAVAYQKDEQIHTLLKNAHIARKIIAGICIAPTILAYAEVLHGKKVTVWNLDKKQEAILKEHGARYTGEEVSVDGRIITANGPQAAEAFGKKIVEKMNSI